MQTKRRKPISMQERTIFNPAQLHVLNMMARVKTQEGMERLKEQLAAFYAQMIDDEMDALWESGRWNETKLTELKSAHLRTPYK